MKINLALAKISRSLRIVIYMGSIHLREQIYGHHCNSLLGYFIIHHCATAKYPNINLEFSLSLHSSSKLASESMFNGDARQEETRQLLDVPSSSKEMRQTPPDMRSVQEPGD